MSGITEVEEPLLEESGETDGLAGEEEDTFDVEGSLPPSTFSAASSSSRPRKRGGALRGSMYAGDSRKFREKKTEAWATTMGNMESLDYEVVDNKVFRARGRHKASITKWGTTIITGVMIGVTAFFIEFCIAKIGDLRLDLLESTSAPPSGGPHYSTGELAKTVVFYCLSGAALAMGAGCLVLFVAPPAVGAGVALVMANLNGLNVPGLLSFSTLLVKISGTVMSVSSGLPVGPEGPLVHVGACISSFFTHQQNFSIKLFGRKLFSFKSHMSGLDFFHNDHDRRDFLSCGAASGLAAAFGAPIGGVLFSLEEASTFWSQSTTWHTLVCTTLATFTLTLCHGGGTLSSPGLIKFEQLKHGFQVWELLLFALLSGALGGLGAFFNGGFQVLAKLRPKSKQGKLAEIAVLVTACNCIWLIPYFVPHMWGWAQCLKRPESDSYDDINKAALQLNCGADEYNDWAVLSYGPRETVIKLLLRQNHTVPGFGVGGMVWLGSIYFLALLCASDCAVPSGFFMPAILIGSCFGGSAATLFNWVLQSQHVSLDPGLYALVGATAMLAGLFRSAISLVVIMLEGTGNIQYLLPLLVAVTAAKTMGNLFNHSIYHIQLHMKKIPFLDPGHGEPQEHMPCAGEIMAMNVITFNQFEKVRVVERALHSTHNGFPVVKYEDDKDGVPRRHFRGMIYRSQLLTLLGRRVLLTEGEALSMGARLSVDGRDASAPESAREAADQAITDDHFQLDAAMRTYFHRHTFYNRTAETGAARLDLIGLSEEERELYVDMGPYMNISPMTVQKETSCWRAFKYFHTMGLRHIPVVDEYNSVEGIITRKDLIKHLEHH